MVAPSTDDDKCVFRAPMSLTYGCLQEMLILKLSIEDTGTYAATILTFI